MTLRWLALLMLSELRVQCMPRVPGRLSSMLASSIQLTPDTRYTGTTSENTRGLVLNGRTAAYKTAKIEEVQAGTKISMDVQLPELDASATLQYMFALTTKDGTFYPTAGAGTTATSISTEFASVVSGTTRAVLKASGKYHKNGMASAAMAVAGDAASDLTATAGEITGTTYNITFEKQAYDAENSWIITVKDTKTGGKVVTKPIPASAVDHEVFDNGAYIVAGAMAGGNHKVKINNVVVTQPAYEAQWTKLTPDTRYTGTNE